MHKRFGRASFYDLTKNRMANGRMFDPNAMNAAMLNVPLGTMVKVTMLEQSIRLTSRSQIEVHMNQAGLLI